MHGQKNIKRVQVQELLQVSLSVTETYSNAPTDFQYTANIIKNNE
jgi:hypothetical protein